MMRFTETSLIITGVAALLFLVYVLLYNRLQRLRIKVEETGSDIDVALEKRYDMLSEQLEAVKKYLGHEYQTLTDITALRSGTVSEERRLDQQQELSDEVIRSIDALCEQYPTLNSWMSMDYFQRAVYNTEEHLQAARRLYNSNVSLYNQTLVTIPWVFVAAVCHMEPAAFYEVEKLKRTFQANFD